MFKFYVFTQDRAVKIVDAINLCFKTQIAETKEVGRCWAICVDVPSHDFACELVALAGRETR